MKIFYSAYTLEKTKNLNSQDRNKFQTGYLLKVTEDENWGVADLSTRPELGDKTAEEEIKTKAGLFQRALNLAKEDMQARKSKVSLLKNKKIKNNYLITDYKSENFNNKNYINNTLKIKADKDIVSLSSVLNALTYNLKLRLDFNSCLKPDQYSKFLTLLSDSTKSKIEYIEDPTPINDFWKSWNKILPLAFDFQNQDYSAEHARYQILKPSRQSCTGDFNNIILTSAMGHPVGLAHGLRVAQDYAQKDSGFLTLDLFSDNGFSVYFEQEKNYLNFSKLALNDYGIGMTAELNKLEWIAL